LLTLKRLVAFKARRGQTPIWMKADKSPMAVIIFIP
jgi:hypothetical protein